GLHSGAAQVRATFGRPCGGEAAGGIYAALCRPVCRRDIIKNTSERRNLFLSKQRYIIYEYKYSYSIFMADDL
ncbi:MAG: hypothetical protein RR263_01510, partial [Oscillospiraceae bacterium]